MSTTSLRTVWLSLRATNYTTAALTGCLNQINGLIKGQLNLAMAQIQLGKSALMAGTMFQVLGQQMGGVGGHLLSVTGAFMQFSGIATMAMGTIQTLGKVAWSTQVPIKGLAVSYQELAISVMAAFAAFIICEEIFSRLPAPIGALIGVVLALAAAIILLKAASEGPLAAADLIPALALGGAAIGAMYGAYESSTSGHQMGTRMIGRTGPAFLHRGEVVYNPATGRPTQVGNDLAGGRGGSTMIDASMHVDNLNTKMGEEELERALKKQSRTIAQNNR